MSDIVRTILRYLKKNRTSLQMDDSGIQETFVWGVFMSTSPPCKEETSQPHRTHSLCEETE